MAANPSAPKPKAVEVELADGREVTICEPTAAQFTRLFGVELAVGKLHSGDVMSDADEANVRHAICLLSVVPVDEAHADGHLTEDDLLALSHGDWARLFVGLLRVMKAANDSPLATTSDSESPSSSSATAPAKARRSPAGPRA